MKIILIVLNILNILLSIYEPTKLVWSVIILLMVPTTFVCLLLQMGFMIFTKKLANVYYYIPFLVTLFFTTLLFNQGVRTDNNFPPKMLENIITSGIILSNLIICINMIKLLIYKKFYPNLG
jgi:hypothetical protein